VVEQQPPTQEVPQAEVPQVEVPQVEVPQVEVPQEEVPIHAQADQETLQTEFVQVLDQSSPHLVIEEVAASSLIEEEKVERPAPAEVEASLEAHAAVEAAEIQSSSAKAASEKAESVHSELN
jgi:hypothetical protein